MVSVSLNTAVVTPKAEAAKVVVEPIATRKGDYVKTPVSALEFQDYLQTTAPPKDELIISESSPVEFSTVIADKTRREKREESAAEASLAAAQSAQAAANVPNPAAVPPPALDLVSEPKPISQKVPKVTGSENKEQSPRQHTAEQHQSGSDTLELSDKAREKTSREAEPEQRQPEVNTSEDLDIEDHFNGLF